jgi:hypothetical protein
VHEGRNTSGPQVSYSPISRITRKARTSQVSSQFPTSQLTAIAKRWAAIPRSATRLPRLPVDNQKPQASKIQSPTKSKTWSHKLSYQQSSIYVIERPHEVHRKSRRLSHDVRKDVRGSSGAVRASIVIAKVARLFSDVICNNTWNPVYIWAQPNILSETSSTMTK